MRIREMTENDLLAVCMLENQNFSNSWSQKSFEDAIGREDTVYLTAEEENKVIGFCGIWLSYETADLCHIVVDPSARGKGVATKLLQQGILQCRERFTERLLLEVRSSNLPAIQLYKKNNFKSIHIRKEYYSNPTEDAVIMCLEPI